MRTSLSGIWPRARGPMLFLLAALLWPAALSAQAAAPLRLDVDKAVEMALSNNLSLHSTRIDVDAKKRKVDTAWNVFVPTVDVGGTLGRWNTEKSTIAPTSAPPFFGFVPLPGWTMSGRLSAELTINAALFEGLKSTRLDYESGLLTYEQAKRNIELKVRKGYFEILLLKENISIMQENLLAAEKREELAIQNYRAGLQPELTVLQARVAAANLKPMLAEMSNTLDAAIAMYVLNLGLPRNTRLEFESIIIPEFVNLDAEALRQEATNKRSDLLEIRLKLRQTESAKKITNYELKTPSLLLSWMFDPSFAGDPWKDSWIENDWNQSSGRFSATLAFRLNGLLPFASGKLGKTLTEFDEAKEQLSIALALTARGMETEVDSLVQKLEKSRRSVGALALNVELAERAYRLSEEAYKAGAKDLLDVQNAELELRKAQYEVLREKFNYITGLIDLEYAIGVPFGTLSRNGK